MVFIILWTLLAERFTPLEASGTFLNAANGRRQVNAGSRTLEFWPSGFL